MWPHRGGSRIGERGQGVVTNIRFCQILVLMRAQIQAPPSPLCQCHVWLYSFMRKYGPSKKITYPVDMCTEPYRTNQSSVYLRRDTTSDIYTPNHVELHMSVKSSVYIINLLNTSPRPFTSIHSVAVCHSPLKARNSG